jgi:hypothetical protein
MVLQPSVTMLMLMLATGARYRIGIGGRANDFIYTLPVAPAPPSAHQIVQSAMTAVPFGVDVRRTSWRPELFVDDAEREHAEATWRSDGADGLRILVNIAAGEARRRWPPERVEAAIRAAREAASHCTVLVMAPPAEVAEAERDRARGRGRRRIHAGHEHCARRVGVREAVRRDADRRVGHLRAVRDAGPIRL